MAMRTGSSRPPRRRSPGAQAARVGRREGLLLICSRDSGDPIVSLPAAVSRSTSSTHVDEALSATETL